MTTDVVKYPSEELRDYLVPRLNHPDVIEVDGSEVRVKRASFQYVSDGEESPFWKFSFPNLYHGDYDRKAHHSMVETHVCDGKNRQLPHKNTLASIVKYLNWYLERETS